MRFYTSSTHNASNFIAKMGYSSSLGTGALNIKGGAGISGGLIFRRSTYDGTNTGTAALITAVLSTNGNGGSATTGDDFLVSGVDMNLHLQSATNSIILQGQHGIKILQDDDANHGLTIVTPDDRYGTVAFSDGSGGTITHSGFTCTLPYWNELSTDAKTAAATLYAALKSLAEAATCPED